MRDTAGRPVPHLGADSFTLSWQGPKSKQAGYEDLLFSKDCLSPSPVSDSTACVLTPGFYEAYELSKGRDSSGQFDLVINTIHLKKLCILYFTKFQVLLFDCVDKYIFFQVAFGRGVSRKHISIMEALTPKP